MKCSDKARRAVGASHMVSRQGRGIEYYKLGSVGPCVLLVASAGREASDFNELATALVDAGFQTLSIEPPGIGGSELPSGEMTLFDLADDLAVVAADAQDAPASNDSVFVVGHAFGNRVARAFAQKYPDQVAALVLVAAGGSRPVPSKASQALTSCFDETLSPEEHQKAVRYGFFASSSFIPDYWRRGWHGVTAAVQGAATRALDPKDWIAAGGVPMLVLQAAFDTIAPPQDAGEPLRAQYPDRVELVTVPNAGHALLPEQPDLIAKETIAFLTRFGRNRG